MADESTLLTGAVATPTPAAPAAGSGEPNATPKGDAPKPAAPAAGAAPDGSGQDPTKPKDGEGKPGEGQPPKPPAPAAPVVPEKYADFTVPEGFELRPEVLGEFTAAAKELKLTQEQAQKLVDLQTKVADNMTKDSAAQFEEMKASWKQDTLKILGSDADKQLALAAAARDKFGTEALRTFLDESGLGSHPAVVQFFISVGKGMSEDGFSEGANKPVGTAGKSHAQILYPENK